MGKDHKRCGFEVAYLILSYAVWGVFWGSWGALLPAIKSSVGASDSLLGLALIGITVGALPAMSITGLLLRQYTRSALVFGLLFFAASMASVTLVKTPLMLAISLFFVGSASGMLDVIMNSGIATYESITGKRYFNYAHAAFPVAVVVASPAVGLARQWGIRSNIILLCIAAIVAGLGLVGFSLRAGAGDGSVGTAKNKTGLGGGRLILTRATIVFGVLGLLVHLMENAVEQWSAIYLEDQLLSDPAVASLGLTGYMAMLFVGRMAAQSLTALWSERRLILLASAVVTLGFLTVVLSSTPAFAITGFALAGLGIAPVIPAIFSLVGRSVSADQRVGAISAVTTIAYAGYLLSPPFVGYISGALDLRAAWACLTAASLLVAMLNCVLFGSHVKRGKDFN